jgi:hypothetical protein
MDTCENFWFSVTKIKKKNDKIYIGLSSVYSYKCCMVVSLHACMHIYMFTTPVRMKCSLQIVYHTVFVNYLRKFQNRKCDSLFMFL